MAPCIRPGPGDATKASDVIGGFRKDQLNLASDVKMGGRFKPKSPTTDFLGDPRHHLMGFFGADLNRFLGFEAIFNAAIADLIDDEESRSLSRRCCSHNT
jgi:hypothetical protein